MAGAIYNTLTNAYLGPESDGTCNDAIRRVAFDALAMHLLFYDRIICLADDLAVLPLLVEIVGFEYLLELLGRGELQLLRTRMVAGMHEGKFLWVSPREIGKATFGRHDWPKLVFASYLPQAASQVARFCFPHLQESQVRALVEGIVKSTIEVDRGPIGPRVFGGLADEVSRLNDWIVETGHHKGDVVRLDERRLDEQRTEHRLVVLSEAVDRNRLERAVLNFVGLKHEMIVPSVAGLDPGDQGSGLHTALPCGWRREPIVLQRGVTCLPSGAQEEDIDALGEVLQALEVPNVGELIRKGGLSPAELAELRESRAGGELRRWYAENAVDDPGRAAAEARELIQSRAKGSVGARVVDFLLGRVVSRFVSIGAMACGVPPDIALMADDLTSVLHAWFGRSVAKLLCDSDHPLTVIERLRQV